MDNYVTRHAVNNLAPAATIAIPHTLEIEGAAVRPAIIWPDRATPIVVQSADATEVVYRNDGTVNESAVFEVKWVHSVNSVPLPDFYWNGIGISGSDTTRIAPPEKWNQQNVPAGQTDVELFALMSTSFDRIKMPRAGSIIALSTRFTEAITDATPGSAVVTVTINGVAGTLALAHSSAVNPSGGEATQAAGIDTYNAGDELGIQITTLGSFVPNTTDLEAWLTCQE
jgi:hypothetical protein